VDADITVFETSIQRDEMKLGYVNTDFKEQIIDKLGVFFRERGEVLAAYLFGSAAEGGPVVNDIDVMVLFEESETNEILLLLSSLDVSLAEHLGLSSDKMDLVPFDLRLVKPGVLYEALNTGILLKCSNEGALTDAIENLSHYFLENEGILRRQEMLEREMFG
jgi:predicted nucleotidyltransferase